MAEMGRPRLEVDWDQVDKMAAIHCTATEICNIIGVSEDTMLRRCREKYDITFADYLDQKRAPGRMSLRRKQYETAMNGNVTMQIWLGKQWLGQAERQILDHDIKGEKLVINLGKPETEES